MASAADCIGVVYPELTVTKSTALAVSRSLADSSWECELSFLVVGSHHEKTDEGWFNVAAIMDGYGTLLEPHRKLFQYLEGEGPHEAIENGTTLPILILEQAVVAFGICLDFCNLSEEPPYLDLDVDYVVVPSCGNATTMNGHIRRSTQLLEKLKSRSIVVQQFYDPKRYPKWVILPEVLDKLLPAECETRTFAGIWPGSCVAMVPQSSAIAADSSRDNRALD